MMIWNQIQREFVCFKENVFIKGKKPKMTTFQIAVYLAKELCTPRIVSELLSARPFMLASKV